MCLLPNKFDSDFSLLSFFVNLIFPINHSVNYPKPIIPMFHHSNVPIGAKPLSSNIQEKSRKERQIVFDVAQSQLTRKEVYHGCQENSINCR